MYGPDISSDEDDYDGFDYGFDELKKSEYRPPPSDVLRNIQSQDLRADISSKWAERTHTEQLFAALERKDLAAIEEVFATGLPVDTLSPKHHWTPLKVACSKAEPELVSFLIQHGANPNKDTELHTPLMACNPVNVMNGEALMQCLVLLLEAGADPNAMDKFKMTSLMYACKYGHILNVRRLLQVESIELNAQDKEGWTALFHAVESNQYKIVELLLEAGCDTNLTDLRNGNTAVDLALLGNMLDIAQLLGHIVEESPSEVKIPSRDPLHELLSQLPDENGNGGFPLEVNNILEGVGLGGQCSKLVTITDLPCFLNINDEGLLKMGIKFAASRQKIQLGIHRFHLQPWKKSSMFHINEDQHFGVNDVGHMLTNMVKHLTILRASLTYLKGRVQDSESKPPAMDLLTVLVDTYTESRKLQVKLQRILAHLNLYKVEAGAVAPDFVYPVKPSQARWRAWLHCVWPAATTVLVACLAYHVL